MATADDNIEFAKAAYEAIAGGDIGWLQEHTHPDVVFQQGGRFRNSGTFQGRDAMFGHFIDFMTMVGGNFSIKPHDFLSRDAA